MGAASCGGWLCLFDEFRFQFHGAKTIDFAVDIVIALDQADVLDLGAHLDGTGGAFHLQVFDNQNGIAVFQLVAEGILPDPLFLGGLGQGTAPFMAAFCADKIATAFIGVFGFAIGAGGSLVHGFVSW